MTAGDAGDGARLDVLTAGQVFLDIVFTGLPHAPVPGTEVWSQGMGSAPGGIANLAVAASRLGLRTGLAAPFSEDGYGRWCWHRLARDEGIDLSHSRRYTDWHTPVTISLAYDDDRAMVTHGHDGPEPLGVLLADPPEARAVIGDLQAPGSGPEWWRASQAGGSLVFCNLGWDPAEEWDPAILDRLAGCHAFMPNEVEARRYTRTETPMAACAALAERVPLAVVTSGARGACAIDSGTGEAVQVPALGVVALDPTGAGDVFGAALVRGTLGGWPLLQRLRFATLAAALAVQQFGGSLAAPGWGDVADWWHAVKGDGPDDPGLVPLGGEQADLARDFAFLDDVLPTCHIARVRRADATIAAFSDLP